MDTVKCTSCKKEFYPEEKSTVLHTRFRTCKHCRELGRKYKATYIRNLYKRRPGAQPITRMCTKCGKVEVKQYGYGDFFCSKCREAVYQKRQEYRDRYYAEYVNKYGSTSAKWQEAKKQRGECLSCRSRVSPGHVYCEECLRVKRLSEPIIFVESFVKKLKIGDLFPRIPTITKIKEMGLGNPARNPITSINFEIDGDYRYCKISTASELFTFKEEKSVSYSRRKGYIANRKKVGFVLKKVTPITE